MKNLMLSVYRFFFANRFFYKFNYNLYILSLKGMGVLNYENNKASGEYNFVATVAKKFKQPIILDVGGNEGNYAALCKKLSPLSEIYSFEPHPKTFARLSKRASELNFNAINSAVSNVHEEVTLYDYATTEGSSHASLYADALADLRDAQVHAVRVSALPLDDFLVSNKIGHVNLLKIDAEGHELKILMGIRKHIESQRVDVIHFEFNEMNILSKTSMKDFYELLEGYTFYRMLPNSLLPLGVYKTAVYEIFLFQNIVAVRNGVTF